jgi:hypothetical protein
LKSHWFVASLRTLAKLVKGAATEQKAERAHLDSHVSIGRIVSPGR